MAKQVRPRIEQATIERLNKATVGCGDDTDKKINSIIDEKEKIASSRLKMQEQHAFTIEHCVKEKRFLASALAVSITVSFISIAFLSDAKGWW